MACHLKISKDGELKGWRFTRAKVRIAANIAYEDAQAWADQFLPGAGRGTSGAGGGGPQNLPVSTAGPHHHDAPRRGPPPRPGEELWDQALAPLWGCWRALFAARQKRDPLELDLPERRVMLDEKGRIASIAPDRLDVTVREDFKDRGDRRAQLEAKKAPVMYRVHEPPSREKLAASGLSEDIRRHSARQVVKPERSTGSSGSAMLTAAGDHGAIASDMNATLRPDGSDIRLGAGHLRSFYVADSPIRRPARPPRPGEGLWARRGRPSARRGGAF